MQKRDREKIRVEEDGDGSIDEFMKGFRELCSEISHQSRWMTYTTYVVQRVSDLKYFKYTLERGSTEQQESDQKALELTEVFPKAKMVVEFV